MQLAVDCKRSLCGRLPQEVQRHVTSEEHWLTLQVPAHQAISETLQLLPGPLVATPILDANGSPLIEPQLSPSQQACAELAYLVDDGPTHFGGLSTTVRVDGHACELKAPGVLDRSVLVGLGQLVVLLVCTGNTCRSPMAEALLRSQLAQRFKDLFGPGQPPPIIAMSAGLSAYPGGSASAEAVTVLHSRGLSLKDHQSRPLTPRLLRQADLILTMTSSHKQAIIQRCPEAAGKTFLLSNNGRDVADPYGGPVHGYESCASEIEVFLKHWVSWIDESWLPRWTA
jgi:protein-tyrosine-phosphatase